MLKRLWRKVKEWFFGKPNPENDDRYDIYGRRSE